MTEQQYATHPEVCEVGSSSVGVDHDPGMGREFTPAPRWLGVEI